MTIVAENNTAKSQVIWKSLLHNKMLQWKITSVILV